jgi:hypothetical protein
MRRHADRRGHAAQHVGGIAHQRREAAAVFRQVVPVATPTGTANKLPRPTMINADDGVRHAATRLPTGVGMGEDAQFIS